MFWTGKTFFAFLTKEKLGLNLWKGVFLKSLQSITLKGKIIFNNTGWLLTGTWNKSPGSSILRERISPNHLGYSVSFLSIELSWSRTSPKHNTLNQQWPALGALLSCPAEGGQMDQSCFQEPDTSSHRGSLRRGRHGEGKASCMKQHGLSNPKQTCN